CAADAGRPDPGRRPTGGPSGPAGHQARAVHQPQDRESARPRRACDPACPRRRGFRMNRRSFSKLLATAAAAWPISASARLRERMRRIGLLVPATADDPEYPTLVGAFLQELQQLVWALGRNLQMDIRWSGGNVDLLNRDAIALAGLAPDVILAAGATAVG